VYANFENKDALFLAILVENRQDLLADLSRRLRRCDTADQVVPAIVAWDTTHRDSNVRHSLLSIEYAARHNVPIAQSTTKIYSRDRNIWHISHEGGELEDPANAMDAPRLVRAQAALDSAQEALDALYARWAELERKSG